MTIHPELKELLVCPQCRGELEHHEEEDELRCLRCRLAYEIRDGIPVMLMDEARPLDAS